MAPDIAWASPLIVNPDWVLTEIGVHILYPRKGILLGDLIVHILIRHSFRQSKQWSPRSINDLHAPQVQLTQVASQYLLKRSVNTTMHVLEKQFNLDEQESCDSGRVRRQRPAGLYLSSRLNSFPNPDAMARASGFIPGSTELVWTLSMFGSGTVAGSRPGSTILCPGQKACPNLRILKDNMCLCSDEGLHNGDE